MAAAGLQRAWRRLLGLTVEPLVPPRSTEDRRLGRLVASTAIAFIVIGGTMIVLYVASPGTWVALVEFATMVVAVPVTVTVYVLARRGAPRAAAWILILLACGAVFFLVFADINGLNPIYHPRDGDTLAWMVLPIFVASAVLSRRAAIVTSALILSAMILVPLFSPVVAWGQYMLGPWLLVAGFALLTIIFAGYRERLENERTSRLLAEIDERRSAQDELTRNRDELELVVAERTRSLEVTNEELVEANRAKSRFLANMSHELRTPLNSIIGFTGIMRQGMAGPLTEEQARQLEMVDSSAHQLLDLINQLLDLSRIESGFESSHPTRFVVDDLLDQLAGLVEPLAATKGLSVEVGHGIAGGGPVSATTDRGKLRQILLNLLGNAIKFTDAGGVTMTVREQDGTVAIQVADTGVGIPAEELESVFEQYRQVPTPGRAKPQGTGLGLTVSRELALLLGGTLGVSSQEGSGSVFTLTIPRIPRHRASGGAGHDDADGLPAEPRG
jgi:signal transduction histidine kinase